MLDICRSSKLIVRATADSGKVRKVPESGRRRPPASNGFSAEEDWEDWGDWGEGPSPPDWTEDEMAARQNGTSSPSASRRRGRHVFCSAIAWEGRPACCLSADQPL